MRSAIVIPFPGPRGRLRVTADEQGLFVERFLHARAMEVNATTRSVVARAIAQFPGGLPAPRGDLERFVDFCAGPRLRRLRNAPLTR